MNHRRFSVLFISTVLPFVLCCYGVAASAKSEVRGAAILDHPCGKVSVKQMGLLHAGKFDQANQLTTQEMQDRWKAMPAKDRAMISGLAKEISQTGENYAAAIRANGILVIDGQAATLTVKETTTNANGTSTSTTTQEFRLDGGQCLVSR